MMTEDQELLRRYAENHAEEAFSELVRRYLDLVWAAAHRITGDADLARDVSQTVFADLARKAGPLSRHTVLAGWLHRAATLAGYKAVRTRARRAERERQAMQFHTDTLPNAELPESSQEALLPLLEEALHHLGETDRNAVVLRFFAQKSLAEVGTTLGISDDAAQKRLSRAVEKLRGYFRGRGLVVSAGGVTSVLAAAGAQAAPTGLGVAITSSALAVAGSSAASSGLLSLLSSVQIELTAMKTKFALLAVTAATVGAPLIIQQQTVASLRQEQATLESSTQQLASLQEENAFLLRRKAAADELQQLLQDHEELLRLREETQRLKEQQGSERAALLSQLGQARAALDAAKAATVEIEAAMQSKAVRIKTINDLKNLGLAARIFATDNQDRLPTTFDEITNDSSVGGLQNINLDRYEFVTHARPVSEIEPEMLLFREKEPRQLPDGNWAKAYAKCDGSVQEIVRPDKNFAEWEKEFIATESTASKTTTPATP